MINSRNINDLDPRVASKCLALQDACREAGIDLLVTSTYRDNASQDALYAQGRTAPGRIVTKAKAGQSWHNYRLAFDVVPIVGGKAVWNDAGLWQTIGRLGKAVGLEWAGDWTRFKEFPHFQWTGGLTLKDLQAGKRP
jgi:peptidoglycan L-alanyl-D-glutamate endopeptidase CwlK